MVFCMVVVAAAARFMAGPDAVVMAGGIG